MKHTIAQNRQLFNVKAIADSKTLDTLAEGEFGVFPLGVDTSLAAAEVYANLPDQFRIISKLGGKVYYSFDTIDKASIKNFLSNAYQAEVINVWKTTIENCDCIKSALVKIGVEEDSLLRRDGLTWTHTDNIVEGAPSELSCQCDCTGQKAYDNNLMTKAISEKINSISSPFYEAAIELDLTGITTYADQAAIDTAFPAPVAGDIAIDTATTSLKVYTGTAWAIIGTNLGVITDVDTFIAAYKTLNTDADETNDGPLLTLVIKGKVSVTRDYKDLDVRYVYPRGVKLNPAISFNGGASSVEFTETQELVYELGAGADLRAEEFETMSQYTNLNYYPQLHDGIASENLIYQFENGLNYNTVSFEFYTEKVNKNDGDKRSFGVILGASNTGVFNALVALFSA